MRNKFFNYIVTGCVTVIFLSAPLFAQELTRGEFIMQLVESLGLSYRIQEGATVQDYVNVLRQEGLDIPGEYDTSKVITVEERVDLLSQAFSMQQKVREKSKLLMESYRNKAVIVKIEGNVMVKPEGETEWIPAKMGMELTGGAYIKTGGGATASLRVGVAGRIVIKENTELLLQTLATQPDKRKEDILLYLAMGEMFVDVREIEKGSKFETYTPTTLAAVRGTTYIIKVEPIHGRTEIIEAVE